MAVNDYNKLMNFTNQLSANNMLERNITKAVFAWMGNISADITDDYHFSITYIFNTIGIAVDANIYVERFYKEEWISCGSYSALAPIPFSQIKCSCLEAEKSEVSTKESDTLHYYVTGYYVPGYYV
jgi:hypothetical protein